jgi:hypothetical protein
LTAESISTDTSSGVITTSTAAARAANRRTTICVRGCSTVSAWTAACNCGRPGRPVSSVTSARKSTRTTATASVSSARRKASSTGKYNISGAPRGRSASTVVFAPRSYALNAAVSCESGGSAIRESRPTTTRTDGVRIDVAGCNSHRVASGVCTTAAAIGPAR